MHGTTCAYNINQAQINPLKNEHELIYPAGGVKFAEISKKTAKCPFKFGGGIARYYLPNPKKAGSIPIGIGSRDL